MKAFFNTHQDLYTGHEPPIYDTNKIDAIKYIEENYPLFKEELLNVIKDKSLAALAFKKKSFSKTPKWTQIELMIYGLTYKDKKKLFPKTYEILSKIEGVSTIYFSFLDKNARIKGHVGDTDAFYRIHLGMNIPASLPHCGMEVAGHKLEWEEGKCIAFNDIYFHSSWNLSTEERTVLIIDLMNPKYLSQYNKVNAGVIATLILSRSYKYLAIIIEVFPRILTRMIHPTLHFFVFIFYRIKNK